MKEIPLNWLAIIVAAVLRQVIGMLWFSPIVFGPAFVRYTGCSEQEMKARLPVAIAWDLASQHPARAMFLNPPMVFGNVAPSRPLVQIEAVASIAPGFSMPVDTAQGISTW